MKTVKIVGIFNHGDDQALYFSDGSKLYSEHAQDCCESHYLDFSDLDMDEIESLKFDLSGDDFFNRIPEYGIELLPLNGHPIRIPGYGFNNGYYSELLTLVLKRGDGKIKRYDVTDCQDITG